MTEKSDEVRRAYWFARDWLWGAIHEVPSGVLDGANAATESDCGEMMTGLEEFARLCSNLDLSDHDEFIEACRWHFEHYPHYLGRRSHFVDYATYTVQRGGPLRVPPAPVPPRWLNRVKP